MSKTAAMWRALGQLAQAEDQALDRILDLAEGMQAATDAGDLDGAAALLDDYAAMRLLAEALPSWRWPGEGDPKRTSGR
jgi:hypothetical protein